MPGRPRLDVLDILTVELRTSRSERHRKYRCAGIGCTKTWQPRTKIRVFSHCKQCLKMTPEQRQYALSNSATSAPGALVAQSIAKNAETTTDVLTERLVIKGPRKLGQRQSSAPNVTVAAASADTFFGPVGRKQTAHYLDLAIVRLFCAAGLPILVSDYDEWKAIFKITNPSYNPAPSTTLMEKHIMSEQERVRALQFEALRSERHITCSFDGGEIRSGEAFYTVHATTMKQKVILLDGREGTLESHTGEWIASYVLEVRSHLCCHGLGILNPFFVDHGHGRP